MSPIERILEMLRLASSDNRKFPATIFYNEGWLLRLVLDWFCLGILIGALVGWYFSEAQKTTPVVLGVSISALVGSSVLAMFSFLAGLRGPTHEYWFYPVGLLIGFVFAIIMEMTFYNYYGERRSKRPVRGRHGGAAADADIGE
jgi:hypothetical protein